MRRGRRKENQEKGKGRKRKEIEEKRKGTEGSDQKGKKGGDEDRRRKRKKRREGGRRELEDTNTDRQANRHINRQVQTEFRKIAW